MTGDDTLGWTKRHPVASFFVLAYTITWLAWLPAVACYRGGLNQPLSIIAQFGPTLAVLGLTWYSGASLRKWARKIVRWRVAPRWYAVAVGAPGPPDRVESAIFGLLGNPIDLSLVPEKLVGFVPSVIVLTLVAGLGEEPGWRGFALPRLEPRHPPVVATLVLGLKLGVVAPAAGVRRTQVLSRVQTLCAVGAPRPPDVGRHRPYGVLLHVGLQRHPERPAVYAAPRQLQHRHRLRPRALRGSSEGVYVTLLVVQDVTLLVAVAVLVVATGGRLAYNASIARAAP
jgi:CAAX protease family protein